jgi:hypothetical protein
MALKHTREVSGPHVCTHLHNQTASHMVTLQHDFQNWNLSPFQKPNFLNLIYHTGLIRLQCFRFSSWYIDIHKDCCLMVCNAALPGRRVKTYLTKSTRHSAALMEAACWYEMVHFCQTSCHIPQDRNHHTAEIPQMSLYIQVLLHFFYLLWWYPK